jgi:hypothetical protein
VRIEASEDAKTTRWFMRYHKADHEKARQFGGYPFGDKRCPVCYLWHRAWDLKMNARRLNGQLVSIMRRMEKFQEGLSGMEDQDEYRRKR